MARESVVPDGSPVLLPGADVDAPYVNRVLRGDTAAFTPLWQKYDDPLIRFFASRVRSQQDAEDLASDTLVSAMQSLPRFRTPASSPDTSSAPCTFRTFLYAIARHKLSHWIRRKSSRRVVELDGMVGSSDQGDTLFWEQTAQEREGLPGPLESVLEVEGRHQICKALAAVPSSNQFKALLLHYMAGLDHNEVGVILAARSVTISNRLQDGRKSFRQRLSSVTTAQ